jgi:hypothetical protein
MKLIIEIILLMGINVLIGCSNSMDVAGNSGIDDPPFPSTESICPLKVGSHWEYWGTWYDTNGLKIQLSDRAITRTIPNGYLLQDNNVLTSSNNNSYYNPNNGNQEYVYRYEWEDLDSGLLVRHIGGGDLDKRGLYIAGKYVHEANTLYDAPVLWLAYPSNKGRVYTIALPEMDSSEIVTMEIMETNAKFYAPIENRQGASPLYFKDSCYLYKETIKTSETYYYYQPKIGCMGYLKYKNGKLAVTYILKRYNTEWNY